MQLKGLLGRRSSWIGGLVAAHGVLIIASTLSTQLGIRGLPPRIHYSAVVVDLPLLLGLALMYVSLLLIRRKRNAWLFATLLYVFLIGVNTSNTLIAERASILTPHLLVTFLPIVILAVLLLANKEFIVRSDMRTFANSLRVSILVLSTAFFYGTGGFLLMDKPDFRQEISPVQAMHYTIDQFDLTTQPLKPYTRRAQVFLDSLSFISVSAVGFVFISLFQPLRTRYTHQRELAAKAEHLIRSYPTLSTDFFKIWPNDKTYLFSSDEQAGVAYRVQRGVALVLGDPFGRPISVSKLLDEFEELCFVNDWQPAFIQATSRWMRLFKKRGYTLQAIGQEAIVDLKQFIANVAYNNYFRRIDKTFSKLEFTTELCQPPHHAAFIDRLKVISDEWLKRLDRKERGFTMGYFNEQYFQRCAVFVARDGADTIQAFLNLAPVVASDEPISEIYCDLVRSSDRAPSKIIDYLLSQLILDQQQSGVKSLNLGLCPLVGLEQKPDTLINRTLRFVYSNGDRFYSFQGLYKFKTKFEPNWSDRFVIYKGGLRDFTRIMRSLSKAMRVYKVI